MTGTARGLMGYGEELTRVTRPFVIGGVHSAPLCGANEESPAVFSPEDARKATAIDFDRVQQLATLGDP